MGRVKLKKARKDRNMTQQAMANYLHISERYYRAIELGKRTGDFGIWDALEELLVIHQKKLRELNCPLCGQVENP